MVFFIRGILYSFGYRDVECYLLGVWRKNYEELEFDGFRVLVLRDENWECVVKCEYS